MDRNQQSNFLELRRRLAELNYTESFGVDALELVGRLLDDLLSTTQSYKQVQETEARLGSDLALAQAQLFPLRKENARLARENHELHVESIRLNDELRTSLEDYGKSTRHLHDELNELHFLADSQKQQLKAKDELIDRLRDAYESATDPSLQGPASSTAANNRSIKISAKLSGAKKSGGLRPHLREARDELKLMSNSPAKPRSSDAAAQAAANIGKLQEAEAIIQTLRDQLENANTSLAEAEEESKRLQSAIASREQELARSSKLISSVSGLGGDGSDGNTTGVPLLVGTRTEQLAAADVSNKRIIDQLNSQVDFLNEQLAQREAQLQENNDKIMQFDTLKLELGHRSSLLDQLRHESNTANSKVRALEQKVLELQDRLHSDATGINEEKSLENDVAGNASIADGSEKLALISKLSTENDDLKGEIARLSQRLESESRAQSRASDSRFRRSVVATESKRPGRRTPNRGDAALLGELNGQVEDLKKKLHTLERAISKKDETIRALEAEKQDMHKKIESAGALSNKSKLQLMYSELQERLAEKEQLLAESSRDRSNLNALADASRKELESLREALRKSEEQKEEFALECTIIRKDFALSKEQCEKLQSDLDAMSVEGSQLRLQLSDAISKLESEVAKTSSLQRKLDAVEQQLSIRSTELTEATQLLAQLQQGQLSDSSVLVQLQADKEILKRQITELESDQQIWFRERKFLLELAHDLGVQIQHEKMLRGQLEESEMQELLSVARGKEEELQYLRDQISELKTTTSRAQSEMQNQDSIVRLQLTELEDLKEQFREQSQIVARYESDWKLLQRRYTELQKNYDDATASYGDESQAKYALHEQLSTANRELLLKDSEMKKLQLANERLTDEIEEAQRQLKAVSKRCASDQEELKKSSKEKDALERKVDELKTLLNNLEGTMRIQAEKQSRLTALVSRNEGEAETWEQERQRFLHSIDERDSKINDQLNALQSLDKERDRLQDLLDAMEEEAQENKLIHANLQRQVMNQQQVVEQMERKVQCLQIDLTNSQRQSAAAEARLNSASTEVAELKRRIGQKSVEVGGAAEDLMLMTRENQALTAEVVEITSERDQLQRKVQELIHAGARTEYSRRAVEVERSDLISTYRNVLQEKRKLEEDMNIMSNQKEKSSSTQKQLSEEIAQLRSLLEQQTQSEARWRSERSAFQVQIENLNDQLVRAQRRYESMEAENRRMMNDAMGLRQSNALLNERINMIIKRASAATEANKVLTERMASVERERDAVRALVNIERQRASDMSTIAEAARVQVATKEIHIQRLRTTNHGDRSPPSSSGSDEPKSSSPSSAGSGHESRGEGTQHETNYSEAEDHISRKVTTTHSSYHHYSTEK